jgi:hypothetical protein
LTDLCDVAYEIPSWQCGWAVCREKSFRFGAVATLNGYRTVHL